MPKGVFPFHYMHNPNIDEPLEKIYATIDAYTGEFFEDEPDFHKWLDFCIILPPLIYEKKFVKGIFFSQGVDFIHKMHPEISKIFFSMAYSMRSAYPWSTKSDAYLTCYKNQHREDWFRKTNPERADKILIPMQDADFTHEYNMSPVFASPKDIDILTVSRLSAIKNLPLVAKALKIYREKYKHHIKMTCIVGKEFDINYNGLDDQEKEEMRRIEAELIHPKDYIDFVTHVPCNKMNEYYSRAKICLLSSLLEGKNRTIQEAMSCNTPIVVFKDLNKYVRANHPIFMGNAGLCIPEYNAESIADTIHEAFSNLDKFTPRRDYLKYYGRKNFANVCIDSFPYYADHLPEYEPGKIHENLWVDLAMHDNYQLSFNDFLYSKNYAVQHVQNPQAIEDLLKFFYSRFGVSKDN